MKNNIEWTKTIHANKWNSAQTPLRIKEDLAHNDRKQFIWTRGILKITYTCLLLLYHLHSYLSENNNWAMDFLEVFTMTHLLQPMPGQSLIWFVSHPSFYLNKTGSRMTTLSTRSPHNPSCREFHKPSVQEEQILGRDSLTHLLL